MTVQGYIVVEVQKDRKGQNHLKHEREHYISMYIENTISPFI